MTENNNNFGIGNIEEETNKKTFENNISTSQEQVKNKEMSEGINGKINGEYKNEDIVSGETNLEVGIENDPRFKEIIEQALDGIDLSEEALIKNPEVVKKAKEAAEKEEGKKNTNYNYLIKGISAVVAVIVFDSCANNGIYRAETAEGGFKQTALYAITDVLFKKAKKAGYEPGPLGRRVLESADNTIGEQTRDWDTPAKMEEANNAYEYGLKHPNAECSIYVSGEGNRRNGYHEYNACKKGKVDREKNKNYNKTYNQQNNDPTYKQPENTRKITGDINAGKNNNSLGYKINSGVHNNNQNAVVHPDEL